MWVRTGASGEDAGEDTAPAAGFTGRSPAFLVAVTQLLGLQAEGSSSVRLVALIEPALAPVPVVAWSLTTVEEYPAEVGPLPVERYETVDLAPHLKQGRNVLAALVWNWGKDRPVAQFSRRTAFFRTVS